MNDEVSHDIPWPALMILILGSFMSILDSSIVNVALPKLMAIFGVTADDIQWVMTAYLLTSGVVVPMSGYLSDRYGGKRLYIASLIVFTIGSGLCAFAWSNNSLIFARVLQALGGGMIIPVSMAMMFNLVPREKMGMAMGVWGISAMVAPAIGPTLGGYLVDNFGWPWIFTINLPIGVGAVFMSGILLKETPRRTDLKPDIFGSVLVAIACFTVLLALSQGQDKGWTSLYIVNLIIISVFTFALFVIWELNVSDPLIDIRLLKKPHVQLEPAGYRACHGEHVWHHISYSDVCAEYPGLDPYAVRDDDNAHGLDHRGDDAYQRPSLRQGGGDAVMPDRFQHCRLLHL